MGWTVTWGETSWGEMSYGEKCHMGRDVMGRNVVGRNVAGWIVFWGEMLQSPFFCVQSRNSCIFNKISSGLEEKSAKYFHITEMQFWNNALWN